MTRDEAIEISKNIGMLGFHDPSHKEKSAIFIDALIELGLLKVDEPKKTITDMLAEKLICSTEYLQKCLDELGFKVTLK